MLTFASNSVMVSARADAVISITSNAYTTGPLVSRREKPKGANSRRSVNLRVTTTISLTLSAMPATGLQRRSLHVYGKARHPGPWCSTFVGYPCLRASLRKAMSSGFVNTSFPA